MATTSFSDVFHTIATTAPTSFYIISDPSPSVVFNYPSTTSVPGSTSLVTSATSQVSITSTSTPVTTQSTSIPTTSSLASTTATLTTPAAPSTLVISDISTSQTWITTTSTSVSTSSTPALPTPGGVGGGGKIHDSVFTKPVYSLLAACFCVYSLVSVFLLLAMWSRGMIDLKGNLYVHGFRPVRVTAQYSPPTTITNSNSDNDSASAELNLWRIRIARLTRIGSQRNRNGAMVEFEPGSGSSSDDDESRVAVPTDRQRAVYARHAPGYFAALRLAPPPTSLWDNGDISRLAGNEGVRGGNV